MTTPAHRWPLTVSLLGTVLFSCFFTFQEDPLSKAKAVGSGRRALTLLNNPFFPAVRALPEVESGKAVLKLRNYSHETIVVENLLVSDEGEFHNQPLLKAPLELRPADTEWLDVTAGLGTLLPGRNSEIRKKTVRIEISLLAKRAAPQPCDYVVAYDGRSILEFSFREAGVQDRDAHSDSSCLSP